MIRFLIPVTMCSLSLLTARRVGARGQSTLGLAAHL